MQHQDPQAWQPVVSPHLCKGHCASKDGLKPCCADTHCAAATDLIRVLSSHRVASKSSSVSILKVARRATMTAAASWSKPETRSPRSWPVHQLQGSQATASGGGIIIAQHQIVMASGSKVPSKDKAAARGAMAEQVGVGGRGDCSLQLGGKKRAIRPCALMHCGLQCRRQAPLQARPDCVPQCDTAALTAQGHDY